MASVTHTVTEVTKVVREGSVTLTLTFEEAQVLKRILQRVAGVSRGRTASEAINNALYPVTGNVDDAEVVARGEITLYSDVADISHIY